MSKGRYQLSSGTAERRRQAVYAVGSVKLQILKGINHIVAADPADGKDSQQNNICFKG